MFPADFAEKRRFESLFSDNLRNLRDISLKDNDNKI